jgi:hypothetical protein
VEWALSPSRGQYDHQEGFRLQPRHRPEPGAKLKAVFGKDEVTMFEMTGLVSKHLT